MSEWLCHLWEAARIDPATWMKVAVSLALVMLAQRLVVRLVFSKSGDVHIRYRWRKQSGYIAVFVLVLILGAVWFEVLRDIGAFLGLLSAGLAIALKDMVANVAGWIFIIWRKPFELGDRIQLGDYGGDVIDVRVFEFSLMEIGGWVEADQSTGRVVHVPNGLVLSLPLVNYTKGFNYIWNEVPVLVTFESDWEKAKGILLEIAERHAKEISAEAERDVKDSASDYLIVYSKLTPTVYTSVRDSGVMLTIRYLCRPRARRGTEQAIWEDVLRQFNREDDVELAYPTRRFYMQPGDGAAAGSAGPGEEGA